MTEREHLLTQLGMRDMDGTGDSRERLVVEMDNRADLTNSRGALQGGLVATLIDVAAGRLADNAVGPDRSVATADLNIHYLAAIVEGPARAEATIVRAGSRTIVAAVDVSDAGRDRLAARATLSFVVLEKR